MNVVILTVSTRDAAPTAAALAPPAGALAVSVDTGYPASIDLWRGYCAGLRLALTLPLDPYTLIAQDDAVPCRDFWRRVSAYLPLQEPLTLYSCRRNVGDAIALRHPLTRIRTSLGGQAIIYPTALIADLLQFGDSYQQKGGRYQWDDERIAAWTDRRWRGMLATAPSLIQHGKPRDSTCGNRTGLRTARWFADDLPPDPTP